jgi:hypothetical protein
MTLSRVDFMVFPRVGACVQYSLVRAAPSLALLAALMLDLLHLYVVNVLLQRLPPDDRHLACLGVAMGGTCSLCVSPRVLLRTMHLDSPFGMLFFHADSTAYGHSAVLLCSFVGAFSAHPFTQERVSACQGVLPQDLACLCECHTSSTASFRG